MSLVEMELEVLLTPEAQTRLERELERLQEQRREIAARLREAKALGNVEENPDFEEAIREQAILERRLQELRETLECAVLLGDTEIPTEVVGLGSRVQLREVGTEDEWDVTLVTPAAADPDLSCISHQCPLGAAILGHRVGEEVVTETLDGPFRYRIVSIGRPEH